MGVKSSVDLLCGFRHSIAKVRELREDLAGIHKQFLGEPEEDSHLGSERCLEASYL